jgi:hypothetical protein
VERFLKLKESLTQLLVDPYVQDQRKILPDFLDSSYFERMEKYLLYLERMHAVNLLFQTQTFPTGCFVPLCASKLEKMFESNVNDGPFLVNFKRSFYDAVQLHLKQPIFGECNNFLKSSLFHPGVAMAVINRVSEDVLKDCCKASLMIMMSFMVPKTRPLPIVLLHRMKQCY